MALGELVTSVAGQHEPSMAALRTGRLPFLKGKFHDGGTTPPCEGTAQGVVPDGERKLSL